MCRHQHLQEHPVCANVTKSAHMSSHVLRGRVVRSDYLRDRDTTLPKHRESHTPNNAPPLSYLRSPKGPYIRRPTIIPISTPTAHYTHHTNLLTHISIFLPGSLGTVFDMDVLESFVNIIHRDGQRKEVVYGGRWACKKCRKRVR